MRLKKIELFGFKSFADKTEIVFDGGVTCVVGPNGCGKSNISDAIRWVLGERSAKLLRGTKMDDVIFNGTDFRKALAFSEVSLTLDNQDRGLPIDYGEVILTRRLYRSGVSEYFLNRTGCRLKDIQDLILDTGIGSNFYSMIEQGRIDYILSADAEERRSIIEEAAGISKYNVKKEEAIRKLEHTEENRLRLLDIIHEVQKNIQYAERQARRAARYQEELNKLKNLQIRKAFYDLNILRTQKDQVTRRSTEVRAELAENDASVASQRRQIESRQATCAEIWERFRKEEAARYAIQSKLEQIQQEIRFNQEKRIETAARLPQIEVEKDQLEGHLQKNAKDIRLKTEELVRIHEDQQLAENLYEESEKTLNALQASFDAAKAKLDALKQDLFQAASDTVKIRNEYHRLEAFLQTSAPQRRRQEAGEERIREQLHQLEIQRGAAEEELSSLNVKSADLNIAKEKLDQEIHTLEKTIDQLKNEKLRCQQELQEKQNRLDLLLELEKAYTADETALLEETAGLNRECVTSLRDIFNVQPGFEWALEAALDSFLHSLIVKDVASAEALLRRIQERKPSSLGLLIHDLLPATPRQPLPAAATAVNLIPLSQVVGVQREYEFLFAPFFYNVFIVVEGQQWPLAELLSLASERKLILANGVTLGPQGRILYKNGKLFAEKDQFKRTQEIAALQSEVTQLEKVLGEKTDCEAQSLQHDQLLKTKRETLEADRLDVRVRRESFDSLIEGIRDRLTALRRELELLHFESQELEHQQIETAARHKTFHCELETAEKKEHSLLAQQETLVRELESVEQKRNSLLQEVLESKARFSNIAEKSRMLKESLALMKDHDTRDSERIRSLEDEKARLVQKGGMLNEAEAKFHHDEEQLFDQQREADIALELVRQEKERIEKEITSMEEGLGDCLKRHQEFQTQLHHDEMQMMDLGFQEKNISDRLLQRYRVELSELNPNDFSMPPDQPVEELEKQIAELAGKVELLGTVNLLAVEEYEELKKRYDFLLAQQKDLEEARQQLLETIRKINRTTKGLFEETFESVQKTFQEYYQILFRGGHAKLVLLDELHPLESGIDIVVRPPGKKLQSISLLSGGEKALTAIALLFALFRIKPSPFCVLDEVDAPLDEANIDRFLNVLRTFLASTQFIIITHNRKTIAMGESLYGITMEEPGISKIVSVKISQDSPAEARSAQAEEAPMEEQISI